MDSEESLKTHSKRLFFIHSVCCVVGDDSGLLFIMKKNNNNNNKLVLFSAFSYIIKCVTGFFVESDITNWNWFSNQIYGQRIFLWPKIQRIDKHDKGKFNEMENSLCTLWAAIVCHSRKRITAYIWLLVLTIIPNYCIARKKKKVSKEHKNQFQTKIINSVIKNIPLH